MGELSARERVSLDDAPVDGGCHGFQGDHPDLYAAVERIVAAHVARATADAEIVRAEWERQYNYAVEAADRFRKQAADAEARLAAAILSWRAILERTRDDVDMTSTALWVQFSQGLADVEAPFNPAPTTDADGHDERRDGAGGTWTVSHDQGRFIP